MKSILLENDQSNECILLHSTVPCEPDEQDRIQILIGNDETFFQTNTAIAHCISTDAKISKGFAETICSKVNGFQEYYRKNKAIVVEAIPYWNPESSIFIYNLVTKSKFFEKPTLDNLQISLENMRGHAVPNNVTKITRPKLGCGLDKLQRIDVFKLIQDTFTYSGLQIQIITKRETDTIRRSPSNNELHDENEEQKHTNEWTEKRDELETGITRDSKSCHPPCTEQFSILRPKQINDNLIFYYLQNESQDIKNRKNNSIFATPTSTRNN